MASEDATPTFDDSRIKNHPDKLLLSRIRTYFGAFSTGNAEALRDQEAEEYTMSDISEEPSSLSRVDSNILTSVHYSSRSHQTPQGSLVPTKQRLHQPHDGHQSHGHHSSWKFLARRLRDHGERHHVQAYC